MPIRSQPRPQSLTLNRITAMAQPLATPGTPLVLVINDEEWTTRSIESILKPRGYAVLMAYTGGQGLELASKIRPDLLLIDLRLSDMTGTDLCARVRLLPTVRPSTPIILFTSGSLNLTDRMEGFRAGAWAVLQPPFHPEELLAQLEPLIAAKRDTDVALDSAHLDPLTGFYNMRGLLRRVIEISADTARSHRPIACVALGSVRPEQGAGRDGEEGPDPATTRSLGNILLSVTRLSDSVGRIGEDDFLIVAPGTDEEGVSHLVQRITRAVEEGARNDVTLRGFDLKIGFHASEGGAGSDSVVPEELLRRATDALREARKRGNGNGKPVGTAEGGA
jgi:diguanylate cyclase (GGDEF)-like protein